MALVGVLVTGCGGESARVTRTVSASSGVSLISLSGVPPAGASDYQWQLVLRRSIPTSALGVEARPALFDPRSITRLHDGTLVVADGGDPPLAVIPPHADAVALSFSRLGQGPGEIFGGYPVLWPDSAGAFWVADRGNSRVSLFDTAGNVLTELRLPSGTSSANLSVLVQPGTGRLFGQQYAYREPDEGAPEHSVVELDLVEGRVRVVAPLPQEHAPPGVIVLWNARALWTVLGSGELVTGSVNTAAFEISDLDGELVRRIEMDLEPRPVSDLDRARVLRELGRSPGTVQFTDFFPYTDILYPFSDSTFAMRHTWVSHAAGDDVAEDNFVWRLVSSSGFYRGTIRFPTRFEPKWTDGTYLVGVLKDSLGVATIQEYRVVPPPQLRR